MSNERKDIKAEFRVMASAISKEIGIMKSQLDHWNETGCEAVMLQKESQSLRDFVDKKGVPFTPSAGVLEWVNGTLPLRDYLTGSSRSGGAHERYGIGDWSFPKCRKHIATGRVMLPLNLSSNDGPIFVNAKQYHGIIRCMRSRAKAEMAKKVTKSCKVYYDFYPMFMLAEPMMLTSVFLFLFIAALAYIHMDISIRK